MQKRKKTGAEKAGAEKRRNGKNAGAGKTPKEKKRTHCGKSSCAAEEGRTNEMSEKLTRDDIRKIREEIDHRILVLRPKITKEIAEAAAMGDRSENFEYYAAKRANGENNSRIEYLERMLKTAEVIRDESGENEVGLNKAVEVYNKNRDKTDTYKIVTPIRGDSRAGRISIESPIGKALFGHRKGDTVHVETPSGGFDLEIKSVEKNEEDDDIRSF